MVITKELVLKIKAKNRDDVFKQISETLFTNDLISKKGIKNLVKGFKAREAQFSTGMGGGLAIPHSKCKDAKEPKLVLARLEEPVD
jgi:mannitol/fructose-specific phosphotransferase system IIA component (Ntr-type)